MQVFVGVHCLILRWSVYRRSTAGNAITARAVIPERAGAFLDNGLVASHGGDGQEAKSHENRFHDAGKREESMLVLPT